MHSNIKTQVMYGTRTCPPTHMFQLIPNVMVSHLRNLGQEDTFNQRQHLRISKNLILCFLTTAVLFNLRCPGLSRAPSIRDDRFHQVKWNYNQTHSPLLGPLPSSPKLYCRDWGDAGFIISQNEPWGNISNAESKQTNCIVIIILFMCLWIG